MKILIAGSSGFVGSALKETLRRGGHEVWALVRSAPSAAGALIQWDPAAGAVPALDGCGFDVVINLAGENIGSGRWTAKRRQRIRQSRVRGTQTLCAAFGRMSPPPDVLINASAVGIYGDCGERAVNEASAAGEGFLAVVGKEWEAAAFKARDLGVRVAVLRFGMVLGAGGGALLRMLPAFRVGLGGRLGPGDQYVSWIELSDAVAAIGHIMEDPQMHGPVNLVAPTPVTNAEFARCLGRALGRPAVLPVPGWVLRLGLGAMAQDLLLASTRAVPERLLGAGFSFRHETVDSALRAVLGPTGAAAGLP